MVEELTLVLLGGKLCVPHAVEHAHHAFDGRVAQQLPHKPLEGLQLLALRSQPTLTPTYIAPLLCPCLQSHSSK